MHVLSVAIPWLRDRASALTGAGASAYTSTSDYA